MKVRIGPYDFPIWAQSENDEDYGSTYGEFHMDTGIMIRPDQEPSMMASTILHECIHAIHQTYKFPKRLTEEQLCRNIEGPLLAFIRDNPVLIQKLAEAGDGVPFPLDPPREEN